MTNVSPARSLLSATIAVSLCVSAGVAQAEDYDLPRLLVVGTPGTSSGSFASTNGWAPVLKKQTGTNARIVPEDSEAQRYRRLTDRRDIHISSVASAEIRSQTEGVGAYAGIKAVAQHVVWHHNDTPWGFVVSGASDLETMEDLKQDGIRVAVGAFSPPMISAARDALPAYLGLSREEAEDLLTFVPASSYVENCRSVVEGKADVAYCATVSSVLAEMEGAPGGIRWLDMDQSNTEAWDAYLEHRPMTVPVTINMGVSTAQGVGGLTSNFLYSVPADADADFAYDMAKWFHKAYDEYKGSHALSARMSLEAFRDYLDSSPLPVHEGTVRYLKEIGEWTEEDDVWNQEATERMNAWISAREAAMAEARDKRIAPGQNNEEYMAIFRKHTEGLEGFRTRL